MKKLITLLSLISTLNLSAQLVDGSFEYDGIMREYQVYLPADYQPGEQLPLVFNLHGIGSDFTQQILYSQFNAVADTAHFILCQPNGTPNPLGSGYAWDVNFPLSPLDVDDVGFINALIDTLYQHYQINLDKVYACGMSNGGYMAYLLACQLTDRIQAVASVTGSMVPTELDLCTPSMTIPTMQVHGTDDTTVPYDGAFYAAPIEDVISFWVNHNECLSPPDTTYIADGPTNDMSTAQKILYSNCDEDREVLFFKIIGGEHTWPGATIPIGITNQDINASVEIWRFFSKYGQDIETAVHTSVNELSLELFPNPADKVLHIQSNAQKIHHINLYSYMGDLLSAKRDIHNRQFALSIEQLPSGIYLLQIQTSKGSTQLSFVKK